MQRMKVDFPEPEGPITTTTSRGATSTLTSRSTWKSPNHLFTSRQMMMGSVSSRNVSSTAESAFALMPSSMLPSLP